MLKRFLLAAFLKFIQIKRDAAVTACVIFTIRQSVSAEKVCVRRRDERERKKIRPTEIRGGASLNMLINSVNPTAIG